MAVVREEGLAAQNVRESIVCRIRGCGLIGVIVLAVFTGANGQKFYPDDPLWKENDQLPGPRPAPFPGSKLYDLLHKTFAYKPEPDPGPALNINTLGGVPDSSWFTNRVGRRNLSLEELRQGPNQLAGPDLSGDLTITSLKLDGVSPGFVFRDSQGEVFFCKVDVADYPQMATSSEVISSRFLHAFGYNVPEIYLVFVEPERLKLGEGTKVEGVSGKEMVVSQTRFLAILEDVPKRPDGRIQVMASRRITGDILGPFSYLGTRSDDLNDLYPHEHRRELRALKVFASWLNHNDSDSANTLDSYLGAEGQGHVRHYLIDFGTTMGSGAVVPHPRRAGHEYFIERGPMLKAMASFGLWTRPWQTVDYPEYPSVGFFGADIFEPGEWRPDYPNPAFLNMRLEDAFWAARIVAHFSDDMVRVIVEEGQLQNPEAENYLYRTLLERRDRIIRDYFSLVNPLDDWEIRPAASGQPAHLEFRNWGVEKGVGQADEYRYRWFSFDNHSESRTPLGEEASVSEAGLPIPSSAASHLLVRISTRGSHASWVQPIEVYLENGTPLRLIGVERAGS